MDLRGFENTSKLGEYAESEVMALFLKHGFEVLRPFGGSYRYDLCVGFDGVLLKVQVKVGKLHHGFVRFRRVSGGGTKRDPYKHYSKKQVDLFAIYCYELDKVYIVPFGEKVSQIRINEPKNNQKLGVHLACDYEFDQERFMVFFKP